MRLSIVIVIEIVIILCVIVDLIMNIWIPAWKVWPLPKYRRRKFRSMMIIMRWRRRRWRLRMMFDMFLHQIAANSTFWTMKSFECVCDFFFRKYFLSINTRENKMIWLPNYSFKKTHNSWVQGIICEKKSSIEDS